MSRQFDLGFDPRRPIYAGEDMPPIAVTILEEASGTPADVTDALAIFALFDADPDIDPDATEIFQKTVGTGISRSDPASGVLTLQVLGSDTDGLAGDYHYELEVNVGGQKETQLYGAIRLRIPGIDYASTPSLPDFSALDFDPADFAVT